MRLLSRRAARQGTNGQAAAELALLLPVLALILVGMVDFGRVFYTYIAVVNAAREGARYCALDPVVKTQAELRKRVVSSGTSPDTAELGGRFPAADVVVATWATQPDAAPTGPGGVACPAAGMGQDVTVRVSAAFRPITPLVGRFLPQNPLMVAAAARMVVVPR